MMLIWKWCVSSLCSLSSSWVSHKPHLPLANSMEIFMRNFNYFFSSSWDIWYVFFIVVTWDAHLCGKLYFKLHQSIEKLAIPWSHLHVTVIAISYANNSSLSLSTICFYAKVSLSFYLSLSHTRKCDHKGGECETQNQNKMENFSLSK